MEGIRIRIVYTINFRSKHPTKSIIVYTNGFTHLKIHLKIIVYTIMSTVHDIFNCTYHTI